MDSDYTYTIEKVVSPEYGPPRGEREAGILAVDDEEAISLFRDWLIEFGITHKQDEKEPYLLWIIEGGKDRLVAKAEDLLNE